MGDMGCPMGCTFTAEERDQGGIEDTCSEMEAQLFFGAGAGLCRIGVGVTGREGIFRGRAFSVLGVGAFHNGRGGYFGVGEREKEVDVRAVEGVFCLLWGEPGASAVGGTSRLSPGFPVPRFPPGPCPQVPTSEVQQSRRTERQLYEVVMKGYFNETLYRVGTLSCKSKSRQEKSDANLVAKAPEQDQRAWSD